MAGMPGELPGQRLAVQREKGKAPLQKLWTRSRPRGVPGLRASSLLPPPEEPFLCLEGQRGYSQRGHLPEAVPRQPSQIQGERRIQSSQGHLPEAVP